MKTTEPPVTTEQFFDRSIDEVWTAITQLDQMHQWYFDNIPEFKAEVGFKTQFNVEAPSRDFMHLWEVTEVIPHAKLVYKWCFEDLKGESYSIFEVDGDNSKTKLTLTAVVTKDFDTTICEFKRESCQAGWHYFINE
jgi:uncharacterized protein YndB with AHSA1/START domain